MTHHPIPENRSVFDLPFQATSDRIADLQADAATTRAAGAATDESVSGPIGRLRDGIGIRLIELGAALVADDTVKRRVIRS
jgi:hypothetical protein